MVGITEDRAGHFWAFPRLRLLIVHDLRCSGVRNLTDSGVEEKIAMLISGHKTRSVFNRYSMVAAKQLLDAMSAMESKNGKLMGLK